MTSTEAGKISLETLRGLASAEPPCITIVLPEGESRDARIAMKGALAQVRAALEAHVPKHEMPALLNPVESAASELIHSSKEPATFIFLSSPGVCRSFSTRYLLGRRIAAVGECFQLRPLLALASKRLDFYILALRLNDTRILKCTDESFEPVRFPRGAGTEAADFVQGASQAVIRAEPVHDRDHPQNHLGHFYREVDRDVNALLRHSGYPPLVVVGVEHEVAAFLRLTTYPECVTPGIHGLPDRISDEEMYGQALKFVRSVPVGPARHELRDFDKLIGSGKVSTDAREIVNAASDGRVEHLFLGGDAGDPGPSEVGHYYPDLLDTAVAYTLRYGGDVKVLPQANMPGGVQTCAVFRYSSNGRPV